MRVSDFKAHLKGIYPSAAHIFEEARSERELMMVVNTIKVMGGKASDPAAAAVFQAALAAREPSLGIDPWES